MGLKDLPGRFARWSYRGGRPSRLTNLLNGGWAFLHGLGVLPDFLVTLEVRGRRSGRFYANPMVVATFEGKSYLVSMLGERAPRVQNVRASARPPAVQAASSLVSRFGPTCRSGTSRR